MRSHPNCNEFSPGSGVIGTTYSIAFGEGAVVAMRWRLGGIALRVVIFFGLVAWFVFLWVPLIVDAIESERLLTGAEKVRSVLAEHIEELHSRNQRDCLVG